ncbi:uncharacterized protein LOC130697487 [Daphnia carinata]|uniref:uncharacterized protein LOC130697487 n=1 Tax=Daphnia carinata TaxID=120202 RepID=UPI00257E02EF|nr:uncharacterized protein LOC130697487 [Daphnia carinata]
MPRLNQPLSMRKRALQSLAQHFPVVCYGTTPTHTLADLIEDGSYLNIKGPFTQWPSDLLEEMLQTVAQQRPLGRAYLHHLIQPHLESFNLASGIGDVYFAIQFVGDRCQNLQRLDLSYISYLGPDLLCRLVAKLPFLKYINFQMTPINDQVLGQIGETCRQLRSLDVSSTPISDRGLELLGRKTEEDGLPCQLTRLLVTDTYVSHYGIATALRTMPQLRQVEYEFIYQVFDHLTELGGDERALEELIDESNGCPPYRLTSLKSSDPLSTSENLVTALHLCPDLQSVALTSSPSFQESALWNLSRLSRLCDLSLANGPSAYSMDFYTSIVPVLQAVGHQLNNLILTRFTCVDIQVIGMACLELKNLALSEICHFAPVDSIQPELYTQLEALELWALAGAQLPALVIKQLTTPCQRVQNLLFRNCHVLTDQLFNELWTVNPMMSLSHATFDGCRHVSLTLLLELLQRDSDLNLLRLWNCPQLDQDDYALMLATVKSTNMDVYVDWYPYDAEMM